MPAVNTDLIHSTDPNITYEGSTLDQIRNRNVNKTVQTARQFWSEDNNR